jgi:hypothetical protein
MNKEILLNGLENLVKEQNIDLQNINEEKLLNMYMQYYATGDINSLKDDVKEEALKVTKEFIQKHTKLINNKLDEHLKEIKKYLLNNGFFIIEVAGINSLTYSDGIDIGHISEDFMDGYHISSVYKPNRDYGTGCVYKKGLTKNIQDFKNAMRFTFDNVSSVKWYRDMI